MTRPRDDLRADFEFGSGRNDILGSVRAQGQSMVKKIHAYLSTHGMMLMVIGFAVSAGGLLAYIYNLNNLHNPLFARVAYTSTITGFSIYLVGRIYVAIKRRRDRAAQDRQLMSKDGES